MAVQQVKLSVILPVYNAGAYVQEAIDSILAQDFRDYELLIADDGSSDDSLEKIRAFNDPRIRVIVNTRNTGLIGTLNGLINESKGTFIARMDADDRSAPNRFSQQLDIMHRYPDVGIVSSFMGVINGPEGVVKHRFVTKESVKAALPFTNPIVHPAVMFRKAAMPADDWYDKKYIHAEDYGLWIRLLSETEFMVAPLPLLYHRTHSGQVSVSHYEQQKRSISAAHETLFRRMGFTPCAEELQLHLGIFLEQFERTPGYTDRAEQWLLKVVEQNRNAQLIPVDALHNVAGEWWFRICQTVNTGLKRYRSSPLSGFYSPPLKSKAKLIAKSLLSSRKPDNGNHG